MRSSFKVYLLTGTFYKGNGQLCQFNLSKFIYLFFNVKLLSFKKIKKKRAKSLEHSLGKAGWQEPASWSTPAILLTGATWDHSAFRMLMVVGNPCVVLLGN